MAQSTGSTSPTVAAVLTTDFQPGVQTNILIASPLWAAFMRQGSQKLDTQNKTTQFAIKTRINQNARNYGDDDPSAFARTDGAPTYTTVQLTYKKGYVPYRLSHEVVREATAAGAHFDVMTKDLEDLAEGCALHFERMTCSQTGNDVLFQILGAGGAPTYTIKNYGGLAGETLGVNLRNMNLLGMYVNLAATIGGNPRQVGGQYVASQITAVNYTYGSESVTLSNSPTGAALNDNVYRSRDDNTNMVQGATDALTGLPVLVDDFTRRATFQTVTSATAPEFKSQVFATAGATLDSAWLQKMISAVKVFKAGVRTETGVPYAKYGFTMHPFQEDVFAIGLENERRYTAPSMLTRQGVKPYAGVEQEMLHYSGIPVFTSPLHLRKTVFLLDFEDIFIVHNGPAEGSFLSLKDSGVVERVHGTPQFEWVWWWMNELACRTRNGHVRADNFVDPITDM